MNVIVEAPPARLAALPVDASIPATLSDGGR